MLRRYRGSFLWIAYRWAQWPEQVRPGSLVLPMLVLWYDLQKLQKLKSAQLWLRILLLLPMALSVFVVFISLVCAFIALFLTCEA